MTTGPSTTEQDSTSPTTSATTSVTSAATTGETSPSLPALAGAKVTVVGHESDNPSVTAIGSALESFAVRNGFEIEYTGDPELSAHLGNVIGGDNPADIVMLSDPRAVQTVIAEGQVVPLTDPANATLDRHWDDDYQMYGRGPDGAQYGVPVKIAVKSLVWYKPARFASANIAVPTTYQGFLDVVNQITSLNDGAPLCVGIESGGSTGWPFTDWIDDMVLRQHGAEVYDQWVDHKIPFTDPRIVDSMNNVLRLWEQPGAVDTETTSIAETNFADAATGLVDDTCWMTRQGSAYAGFFPESTEFANDSPDSLDVFYFPDISGNKPILTSNTYAVATNDEAATMAVMQYLASSDYAQARQGAQAIAIDGGITGFLSAAKGQDLRIYGTLEQHFMSVIGESKQARIITSELLPEEVGRGTFWEFGTAAVEGEITSAKAATEIEDSWPTG